MENDNPGEEMELAIEEANDDENDLVFEAATIEFSTPDPMAEFSDSGSENTETFEIEEQRFNSYIEQIDSNTNRVVEQFNTDLPAEHLYLGSMDRVSGVNYLQVGKTYTLPIIPHPSLVYPGETLPMLLPPRILESIHIMNGLVFGLHLVKITKNGTEKMDQVIRRSESDEWGIGVTCQVYEKGATHTLKIPIKSTVHQRFRILRMSMDGNQAVVEILPEIFLPDPLSNRFYSSLNLFHHKKTVQRRLRNFQANSTVWPSFVYDQYDINRAVDKAKEFLQSLQIGAMPSDPTLLSFWLARNTPVSRSDRIKILLTDSVNERLLITAKSLQHLKNFCCKRCKSPLAQYVEAFAMSKLGIATNYCNPSGFIHETMTVYATVRDAVYMTNRPCTEFSWFPGYCWQIAYCKGCHSHIGWKFKAATRLLVPRTFYGLAEQSVTIETVEPEEE